MMKKYSKCLLMCSLLFIALSVLPCIVQAQIADGQPDGDVDAPIDGGISLLIAAGIGYGVKKARDNRKKNVANLL